MRIETPHPWSGDDQLANAFQRGVQHGHGLACHNVPSIGQKLLIDGLGRVTVDAENVREVHQSLCYAAESHSRCYSPFECTASEFNSQEFPEDFWDALDAGIAAAIEADLESYSDADYGIEAEEEETDE
jgi:hypothetical protein